MKLYLMRHGEALSPQQDPERGLTDNGKLKNQSCCQPFERNGRHV